MTPLPSLADQPWLNAAPLRRVFAVVEVAGGVIRVNGGAVRNALLAEPVADIDLSTTLAPERVMDAGMAAGFAIHPTGLSHGTVTVVCDGQAFETTTLRIDEETDGRRAKVAFTDDWQADAHRRDFTVNALYCGPDGKLYDFVGGYPDILKRRIRFVGLPSKRIREDFLRILRFFRFHARYGKGAPDPAGLAACARLRRGLDTLPSERIRQEFLKLIVAPGAHAALRIMVDRRIMDHVLRERPDLKLFRRMCLIDMAQSLSSDAVLRLAALLPDALTHRDRLRLTNIEIGRLKTLGRELPPSPELREAERRRVLYRLGAQRWTDAVRLAWAQSPAKPDDGPWGELLRLPALWAAPRFPVSGKDLVNRGLAPGKRIGRLLADLEDWWVASDFTLDKDSLLARIDEFS